MEILFRKIWKKQENLRSLFLIQAIHLLYRLLTHPDLFLFDCGIFDSRARFRVSTLDFYFFREKLLELSMAFNSGGPTFQGWRGTSGLLWTTKCKCCYLEATKSPLEWYENILDLTFQSRNIKATCFNDFKALF